MRRHLLNVVFFWIFLIAQKEERPLYHVSIAASGFLITQREERPLYHVHVVTSRFLIAQHEERPLYHAHVVTSRYSRNLSMIRALHYLT